MPVKKGIQMRFMNHLAAAALALALVGQVNANIIDHDTYVTDTNSGLDWLDITASVNMSFSYVSSQFGVGGRFEGWRYASGDEFNGLVSAYTGVVIPQGIYGWVFHAPNEINGLIDLLGNTLDDFYLQNYGQTFAEYCVWCTNPTDAYTHGLIGDTNQTAHFSAILYVLDSGRDYSNYSAAHYGDMDAYRTYGGIGSYLVRETGSSPSSSSVPEPTSLALLGLGLAGLSMSRSKSKKLQSAWHC